MAAGQRDIPVLLQPGAGATVRAPGSFLYLKFADREIQAVVTGIDGTQSRIHMVTGDFTRPGGGISEVELVNPDPANPCAVIITVGDGEFDRKVIQGEVTITPGVRGADGQFVDDTRSTVRLRLALGNIEPREYTAGQKIRDFATPIQYVRATELPGDRLLLNNQQNDTGFRLVRNWSTDTPTIETISSLGSGPGVVIEQELWVPAPENLPGGDVIAYRVYDAATLKFRRTVITNAPWENGEPTNPNMNAVDSDGDVLFQVDYYSVRRITRDGQMTATVDLGGFIRSVIYRNGKVHAYQTGANLSQQLTVLDAKTFERLPDSASELPDDDVTISGSNTILHRQRQTLVHAEGSSILYEYSVADITLSASGSVTSCAGGGFLKSLKDAAQAEIYTQRLDDGRVLMSGEILRAALEIYTGRYMPANYLDYVYRVRAENLNGISPRTVDSGGKSFLAAGIPDDASGTFPQTLEITLREGLL